MTTSTVAPAVDLPRALQPVDRCDRCGAVAVYRFEVFSAGTDLLFCGHHFKEHSVRLLDLQNANTGLIYDGEGALMTLGLDAFV